ncbi:hypothetical protein [Geomesophilobacter sediminis]|uniref:Uncharacterized protein n=1 Tax=Geomesophilobacter sediminis TaxID=2798584 RepID=A0A8J7M2V5_9BACT|nr:hypothetical protein [Geomesophilobacter sediminis]MBJ6727509.1 hypothetical protein [Geomesophilobacter sediminis]
MGGEKLHPAVQELDEITSAFFNGAAMADLEVRQLATTYRQAHNETAQALDRLNGGREAFPHFFNAVNLLAVDLRTDNPASLLLSGAVCIGRGQLTTLSQNFNYHVCWQIVNVYELFEVFVKEVYALLGKYENGCWRCSDYGKIPLGDVAGKSLDWFKQVSRTFEAEETIRQLRRVLPVLSEIERNNPRNFKLQFELLLIALLRHIIVHRKGRTLFELFTERLCKKAGIATNEHVRAELRTYLVIAPGEEEHSVLLADLENDKGKNDSILLQRYDHIVRILTSYGALLGDLVAERFGSLPKWKRNGGGEE